MNKERLITIGFVITLGIVVINSIAINNLRNEIDRIEGSRADDIDYMRRIEQDLREDIIHLKEEIDYAQSLFRKKQYSVNFKDNMIELKFIAEPKEINKGDKLYLRVEDKEVEFTGNTAVINLPFKYELDAELIIKSEDIEKKETLDIIYTYDHLKSGIKADIKDIDEDINNNTGKIIVINLDSDLLEDTNIAKAKVKIVEGKQRLEVSNESASASSTVSSGTSVSEQSREEYLLSHLPMYDDFSGDEYDIEFINGSAEFNIDEYWNRDDGIEYKVFLQIEDVYGNLHTSENEIVGFSNSKGSSSTSSGDTILILTTP